MCGNLFLHHCMLIVNPMQCIFDECFNFVIIKKFGMEENPVKIDNLSDDEHNALRLCPILPHEKTH